VKLGKVVHTCNPSTEAEELRLSWDTYETLSQKVKKKKRKNEKEVCACLLAAS
jgi:hypothetical protein